MAKEQRTVIFGASRGLGSELAQLAQQFGAVLPISRKSRIQADFSTSQGQEAALEQMLEFSATKVFYVAGGGPYGKFSSKDWRDHEWAFQVSFLFAARVVHSVLKQDSKAQIILVGSSVAENQADPLASSYAAAKHALRGLYMSIRAESPDVDLRLFSPGYMNTTMLPSGAKVRSKEIWQAPDMARELWDWSMSADVGGHKVYSPHPS